MRRGSSLLERSAFPEDWGAAGLALLRDEGLEAITVDRSVAWVAGIVWAMSLLHMEVGLGRIGHAGADVEADMWRLVVA
jgi:hypothetical protein